MDWLVYVVGAIFVIGIITGFCRGAIKITVSLATTIVTLAIVFFATPVVANLITDFTPMDEVIEEKVASTISDIALFPEISENDCPLFVPIIIEQRDELKKMLISKGVYCPVHWPISKYHVLTEGTRKIYEKELSIICDQRYSIEDMKKICCLIKGYI